MLSAEYMLRTMLVICTHSCKVARPEGLGGSLMSVGPHLHKYLYQENYIYMQVYN